VLTYLLQTSWQTQIPIKLPSHSFFAIRSNISILALPVEQQSGISPPPPASSSTPPSAKSSTLYIRIVDNIIVSWHLQRTLDLLLLCHNYIATIFVREIGPGRTSSLSISSPSLITFRARLSFSFSFPRGSGSGLKISRRSDPLWALGSRVQKFQICNTT